MIDCRKMNDKDKMFIVKSYSMGLRFAFPTMHSKLRNKWAERMVEKLKNEIKVFYNPSTPDFIIGFVIMERTVKTATIHYCMLRPNFQGMGIMEGFFKTIDSSTFFSSIQPNKSFYGLNKKFKVQYNPFLLGYMLGVR